LEKKKTALTPDTKKGSACGFRVATQQLGKGKKKEKLENWRQKSDSYARAFRRPAQRLKSGSRRGRRPRRDPVIYNLPCWRG